MSENAILVYEDFSLGRPEQPSNKHVYLFIINMFIISNVSMQCA